MTNKALTIEGCELVRRTLTSLKEIDAEIVCMGEECEIVAELLRSLVKETSKAAQSQEEYLKKYDGLNQRHERTLGEFEKLKAKRTLRKQQDKAMKHFSAR